MKKLTPKQQRFVDEYLADLNATRAAVRAGYSARNADKIGSQLVGNTRVAAAIAAAIDERKARTLVTADQVIRELARVAFLDPRTVMTWGPDGVKLLASKDLPEDAARCVSEASQTVTESGGTIRVKLASKIDALKLLGEHLGLYKQRVEVETTASLTIIEEVVRAKPPKDDPAV